MTLLLLVIQEYLNEHHPNWVASDQYPVGITKLVYKRPLNQADKSSVWITPQIIEYYDMYRKTISLPYTEQTLLQQIDHAIKHTRHY